MKRVIILHGTEGAPDQAWFPWLKKKVEQMKNDCDVPKLPTPEGQELSEWMRVFKEEHISSLTQNDILVGHSVGATFALRLLEQSASPVHATFLVSGFTNPLDDPEMESLLETFVGTIDWERVKANAGKVYVYHGSDDPWVPVSESKQIAQKLDGKLTIIPDGEHLGESHGYKELPQLWKDLKPLLDQA